VKIHDADELGWMDARGELSDIARRANRRHQRRRAVTRALLIAAAVAAALLIYRCAASGADPRTSRPGADLLPADPFRRCAAKALRGDFGRLADWQHRGYSAGLAAGITVQGTATVTAYYPQEGFPRGQSMRSGVGVSERYAACLRREWPRLRGSYVWTMPTVNSQGRTVGGIREIGDTGANSNHRRFGLNMGSDRWLDYWYPTPTELVRRVPYAIWEAK